MPESVFEYKKNVSTFVHVFMPCANTCQRIVEGVVGAGRLYTPSVGVSTIANDELVDVKHLLKAALKIRTSLNVAARPRPVNPHYFWQIRRRLLPHIELPVL